MKKTLNTNDYVKVKLTSDGIKLLKSQYNEMLKQMPSLARKSMGPFEEPKTDEEGYSEFQLWELMHHFGEYMYNGNPNPPFFNNIKITEENLTKIKKFVFPSFEQWVKKRKRVRVELGAYCCEICASSYGSDSTTYVLAAALADRNPINIYTSQIFTRSFDYVGDDEKLKEWYENAILEFNSFWQGHIKSTYIEE